MIRTNSLYIPKEKVGDRDMERELREEVGMEGERKRERNACIIMLYFVMVCYTTMPDLYVYKTM